ncbi:MAG: glycosyltransferase [Rhodospirillales bacterium]|nr:glycosyltransferase [Rhodospirillales bacterium]
MKVMQVMAGAEHGGAEAFFERLAPALHHGGIETLAVIRSNAKRARLLRDAGLDVVELRFGGRLDLASGWGLRRHIASFQPQVVMTWMNRATAFCPSGKFVHVARLGGYYDLKYYRRCHHLIGNTQDIATWIAAQGWPAQQVHYLPNFAAAASTPAVARKDFYTPPDAPLILALGRLHENKAFDVLLRAIAQVPDVYLWLAGEGPLRGELEHLATQLSIRPRVRFLGWRDDVAALYAAADIFVCPSRHEPLGNVVIEAWAQGLPVVATAAQGPNALIQDGVTGLLIPIDEPALMAQALKRLLFEPDLAETLGAAGQRSYAENFTEAAVIEHYRAFFEKVTACAASPA